MSGRQDWAQADVQCLLCGRLQGRLIGPLPEGHDRRAVARTDVQFAAFCPADRSIPAMRLAGGERFRCLTCGGGVLVDEVHVFSTYPEPVDEPSAQPRRGRPPKPWRHQPDQRLADFGLAG